MEFARAYSDIAFVSLTRTSMIGEPIYVSGSAGDTRRRAPRVMFILTVVLQFSNTQVAYAGTRGPNGFPKFFGGEV
jgi:hypothetical protein